jgi:hypothetical protein
MRPPDSTAIPARRPADIVAGFAFMVLACCATGPANAQLLNWAPQTPPDTVPVYELPRPDYDPPGYVRDSFLFKPSVSDSVGYDSNIFASDVYHVGDAVNTSSEEVTMASQWSHDSLDLDLRTDQQIFGTQHQENANSYYAAGAGRLDLTDGSFLELDGLGSQQPDQRANASTLRTLQRPIYNNWNGTLSYFQRLGDFVEQFEVGVNQIAYLYADEIYLSYVAKKIGDRVSYDQGGQFIPFVEINYLVNDQVFQPQNQSFRNLTALVGFDAHISTVLDADLAVGALQETFLNPDFNNLTRPIATGHLLWNVTPLTSVIASVEQTYVGVESFCNTGLFCQITPDGNKLPLVQPVFPGEVLFQTHRSTVAKTIAILNVEHEIWHGILGGAGAEYEHDVFDFDNLDDNLYELRANLRYLVNQNAQIQLDYEYRYRSANFPTDFTFNTGPFREGITSLTLKLAM